MQTYALNVRVYLVHVFFNPEGGYLREEETCDG